MADAWDRSLGGALLGASWAVQKAAGVAAVQHQDHASDRKAAEADLMHAHVTAAAMRVAAGAAKNERDLDLLRAQLGVADAHMANVKQELFSERTLAAKTAAALEARVKELEVQLAASDALLSSTRSELFLENARVQELEARLRDAEAARAVSEPPHHEVVAQLAATAAAVQSAVNALAQQKQEMQEMMQSPPAKNTTPSTPSPSGSFRARPVT